MSLAKSIPLLGIAAGIALLVVGFNYGNNALVIVGAVLVVMGIFRQFKSDPEKWFVGTSTTSDDSFNRRSAAGKRLFHPSIENIKRRNLKSFFFHSRTVF